MSKGAQKALAQAFVDSYRLSSEARIGLEREFALSTDALLRLAVEVARLRALVPVSNFLVGSAGLTLDGEVFLGVNLEYVGVGFSQTIHSEQFLTAYSRSSSSSPLCRLAVSAAPCGHCRQFLREFDREGRMSLLIGQSAPIEASELLPLAFTPSDLDVSDSCYSQPLENPFASSIEEAARRAASLSYAPYSKVKAGVAVRACDGRIVSGCAIENAAYNPGLPPLQVALINCHALGIDTTSRLKEVVLCQEQGMVDYCAQVRALALSLGVSEQNFHRIEY